MKIFQYTQTQNLRTDVRRYLLNNLCLSPAQGNAFLKVSICIVAGITPTPWGRAPVCVTMDAKQPLMTDPHPNQTTSGANSLRSEGLFSSYSSFRHIPVTRLSVTCSSWDSSSCALVFDGEIRVSGSAISYTYLTQVLYLDRPSIL
jgi:hypothetical protein